VARIDPDGYNIILQGDIVRFVEMPPIERRMLIEEISGISVYEEKKQKALNELEKVESKLKEAEIILTDRNRPVGKIVPVQQESLSLKERLKRLEDQGILEALTQKRDKKVTPPIPVPDDLAQKLLQRDRNDEWE